MMNTIRRAALRSHHHVNITFMGRAQREDDDDVMKLCQLSASQMEKIHKKPNSSPLLFYWFLKRHEKHDNTGTNTTVAPLIKPHSNMTSAIY